MGKRIIMPGLDLIMALARTLAVLQCNLKRRTVVLLTSPERRFVEGSQLSRMEAVPPLFEKIESRKPDL